LPYNWKQVKAIEKKNKDKFLKLNDKLNDNSGIYILTRIDENNIKYAYIGQAKHILTRLAQHMVGYQHIDLSLKKHGLYSDINNYGWNVNSINCDESDLDDKEKYYIAEYANKGYQLRNKTAGGQGEGKSQIDEYRPHKGYRDGLEQGYKNASKEIANLFEKHLTYSKKSDKPNKNQDKAIEKFEEFLEYYKREK
jgi:hypothetical protein